MNTAATQIKICGLRRLADILAVNESQPDFAGFVFAPGKRQVSPEIACRLISQLQPSISPVGVFVGESDDEICRIAAMTSLQTVQLHGKFEPGRIGRLRRRLFEAGMGQAAIWQCLGIPVGKPSGPTFPERSLPVFFRQVRQSDSPDAWLLDSQLAGRAGGTGLFFNWEAFRNLPQIHRVILAGGLDPGNVGTALSILHPSVVDCSSGVETNGWKDPEKIKKFCDQVRIFGGISRYDRFK